MSFLDKVKEFFKKGKQENINSYEFVEMNKEEAAGLDSFVQAVDTFLAAANRESLAEDEKTLVRNRAYYLYSTKHKTTDKNDVGVKIFLEILDNRGVNQAAIISIVSKNEQAFDTAMQKINDLYSKFGKGEVAKKFNPVAAELSKKFNPNAHEEKPKQEIPKASSPKDNKVKAGFIPAGPAMTAKKAAGMGAYIGDDALIKAQKAAEPVQVAGKKVTPPPVPRRPRRDTDLL